MCGDIWGGLYVAEPMGLILDTGMQIRNDSAIFHRANKFFFKE
jgi:hypothetical protein